MKPLIGMILCALIGLAAIVDGIGDAVSDVTCNSHVMAPDEVCVYYETTHRRTRKVARAYGQLLEAQRAGVPIKIGGGVLFLGIAVLVLVSPRRRRPTAVPPWTGN